MSTLNPNILLSQAPQPSPLQTYGAVEQLKNAQQQNQLLTQQTQAATMENQMRQRQLAGQQALIQAINSSLKPDGTLDDQAVFQKVAAVDPQTAMSFRKGHIQMQQNLATMQKDQLANYQTRSQQIADALNVVANTPKPNRQAVFAQQLQQLQQGGSLDSAHMGIVSQIQQNPQLLQDDNYVNALRFSATDAAKQAQAMAEQTRANAAASQANTAQDKFAAQQPIFAAQAQQANYQQASRLLGASKNDADYQSKLNQVAQQYGPDVANSFRNAVPQWQNAGSGIKILQMGMTPQQQIAATNASTETTERIRHDKAMEQNSRALLEGKGASLTPGGLDNAALMYHYTGIVPNLGYGNEGAAARAGVINREAEMFPNDNIAFNKGTFAANEGSLKGLQKSRDAIVAYENTAGKNLDLFLGLASKMPDSGVPWLNTPLRSLSANVVGSANMAAVKAALNVANNEIAKVTANPNLTGQLSDAARQEVASYNPLNATFAQTLAIAKVLKQDMANREQSYDTAIANVQRRMAHPTGSEGNPQGASTGRTSPAIRLGQIVTLRNGKHVAVTKVYPDGTFDAK